MAVGVHRCHLQTKIFFMDIKLRARGKQGIFFLDGSVPTLIKITFCVCGT